jgi:hypothetical protein
MILKYHLEKMDKIKKEESKEEIIKNLENEFKGCELWAIWSSKCWKCGKDIKVAINTTGWSFNPFPYFGEGLWSKEKNEKIETTLRTLGVKRELRYSDTIRDKYIANVCPYCDRIQGDWFLDDELGELIYTLENDFKLLLFKDSILIDKFPNIEEFEKKYWKAFLLRDLKDLEKCKICGCYIDYYPQTFKEYLNKYPESKEIFEKIGKIRKRVTHHISYDPEITIEICTKCHARIHHSKNPKYNKFRPSQ